MANPTLKKLLMMGIALGTIISGVSLYKYGYKNGMKTSEKNTISGYHKQFIKTHTDLLLDYLDGLKKRSVKGGMSVMYTLGRFKRGEDYKLVCSTIIIDNPQTPFIYGINDYMSDGIVDDMAINTRSNFFTSSKDSNFPMAILYSSHLLNPKNNFNEYLSKENHHSAPELWSVAAELCKELQTKHTKNPQCTCLNGKTRTSVVGELESLTYQLCGL